MIGDYETKPLQGALFRNFRDIIIIISIHIIIIIGIMSSSSISINIIVDGIVILWW
jgi:hypothetical protein